MTRHTITETENGYILETEWDKDDGTLEKIIQVCESEDRAIAMKKVCSILLAGL